MASLRDFIPLEKLGEGSFSTVYKVKRVSDGKLYALKKVRMNSLKEKERENAVNEVRILASLESPYIIGYKESIHDEKLNLLCIVMEYADGGDLQKKIAEAQRQKALIVERQIWRAVVHVLKGLQVMHSKGILHRDLKSANVFLSEGCYKLGDLNVSKVNKGRLAYTQTGTPYYASPEVWRDEPYDSKSDIWSFGCIIYEMAALKPPFSGRDMEALYRNVQRCTFERIPSCYSKDLETVIGLCMQKNPKLRPSSSELLANPTVQKYVQRLQMNNVEEETPEEKKELLRTIKVPLGLKGLQKNLPKSNYEDPQQEYSSYSPTYKPLKNESLKLEKNISLVSQVKQTPQKGIVERQLSPRLSPRPAVQPNYEEQSAKILLQMRSHEKPPSIDRNRSERLVQSDTKKQYTSRRQAEIRELQRSLLTKQQEIEEYINIQLKRPLTAINKQAHDPPMPAQRGPIKIYGRSDERRLIDRPSDELRVSKKRQQDYSSSRKRQPSYEPYSYENKRKAESEGNVSYKRLQNEITKELDRRPQEQQHYSLNKNVSELLAKRDDYAAILYKNNSGGGLRPYPVINRPQRSRPARPETGGPTSKYQQRYNIMPSWWG